MARQSPGGCGWRAGAGLALGLLAGCGGPVQPLSSAELAALDLSQALRHCCDEVGQGVPTEFVLAVERNSFWVAPASRAIRMRDAWLVDDPAAQQAVMGRARPLDVILIGNDSRLTGAISEGLFGHAAVYLGTEAELRALGIWDQPAVVPFHPDIRKGKVVIEALDVDVHLSDRADLFETDHVALFRPRGLSRARKREALIGLFEELGQPFDFHFDNDDPGAVYCTELIDRVLPELDFPSRRLHGREVILPDDVAARALIGEVPMDLILFIRGYPEGWRVKDENGLAAEILGHHR